MPPAVATVPPTATTAGEAAATMPPNRTFNVAFIRIVVSLEISGIVVSLEIPESSSHSRFPFPAENLFFIVKLEIFIVKMIRRKIPKFSYT